MARLISRRSLLAATGATAATAAAGRLRDPEPFFRRHGVPIGIQLYTVRDELARDLDGTLTRLASIGYETVEIAGLAGRSLAAFRSALDRAGLRCTSAHFQPRPLFPGPSLEDEASSFAESAKTVGFDLVVMALFCIPRRMALTPRAGEDAAAMLGRLGGEMTADDWKAQADFLNGRGRALKSVGLKLAYHNHNVELAPLPGGKGRIIDLLIERTDPGLVSFEMDVAWVVAGGAKPADLLRRHRGRFSALHVKDLAAGSRPNFVLQQQPADIGSGVIKWDEVLPSAWDAGVRRYYVEQEAPFKGSPLDAVKAGHDFLQRLRA